MYSTSQAFKAALHNNHTMVTRVDVYSGASLVVSLNSVTDGNVTVQDEAIHRRMTLTLTDEDGSLTPSSASDLLAPIGNEIRPYRGVIIPSTGVAEYVPLGVFGISNTRIYDSGDGFSIQIDAYDRGRKVTRSAFPDEYVVLSGTNANTAIMGIVTSRLPGTVFNLTPTTITLPLTVYQTGGDAWKAARDIAAACGNSLFFDVIGQCASVPIPVLTQAEIPDWQFIEGENSTLMYANRSFVDDGTYSHVVVTGENGGVGTPVRGEAKDDNPASDTYYLGDFGDIVLFEQNRLITTPAQAYTVAQSRLYQVIGLPDVLEILCIPNPAHEVFDVLEVQRAKSKLNAKYIANKMTIPLTQDRGMNISPRQALISG